MTVELTQQDLKQAKESLKMVSRDNCRQFLDGIYMKIMKIINFFIAFYLCTKENPLSLWNCRKQLTEANDCAKQ